LKRLKVNAVFGMILNPIHHLGDQPVKDSLSQGGKLEYRIFSFTKAMVVV
jgi:hypothetical protein